MVDRQIRAVLAEVAFVGLERGDIGAIPMRDLRRDLLSAVGSPDNLGLDPQSAATAVDELLDVAEGELGVIVRRGPGELGFLHRMLQDQLAAEYVSDRLPSDVQSQLFDERIGDPRWREVLLAVLWRLRRPSEMRALVDVVRRRIDETPTGLMAREVFAEVVFGPFNFPGADAREAAPALIEIVETHPNGAHRGRLLDSVFGGLDNITTGELVGSALGRWTLQIVSPSPNLVWHLSQLPPHADLFETITTALMRALTNPDKDVAYTAALAVASRCSTSGLSSAAERKFFYERTLRVVADPPSGIAQAAALTSLALGWRQEPPVGDLLTLARGSRDEGVRIVALADALGVLHAGLGLPQSSVEAGRGDQVPLADPEHHWLAHRLLHGGTSDAHGGLRVEAIAATVRHDERMRAHCVRRVTDGSGPDLDLIWRVALRSFPDDERIANAVCDGLRQNKHSWPTLRLADNGVLADAYPEGTPHRSAVADAIEDHIARFGPQHRDVLLFELASIDRGPRMREALLSGLHESSFPHWAARALAEHFAGDEDIMARVRSVLAGDPVRASMIASAAPLILEPPAAIARLLEILHAISVTGVVREGRVDIVAHSLVRAWDGYQSKNDLERDKIAAETLALVQRTPPLWGADPSYDLAVAFYPSPAARNALERLALMEDHSIVPYLRVYRDDAYAIRPFAVQATDLFRSLPAWQRQRICHLLANRSTELRTTLKLTRRWADETNDVNKSVASLTYHSALLEAKSTGLLSDDEWEQARSALAREAAVYGPDHDARRRAAWVGICVLQDWAIIDGIVETIGDPIPVGVPLISLLDGPDIVLLQQLAVHWQQLRAHFGEGLLSRLSGLRATETKAAWNALAIVASQSPVLEADLEDAIATQPKLLDEDGVLAWFVSRPSTSADLVADALVRGLVANSNARNLAAHLLADPEQVGLDRELLRPRLEAGLGRSSPWGRPALETLAALFPDDVRVTDAWQQFSQFISEPYDPPDEPKRGGPHPHTYLAVAYAAVDSDRVVSQIRRDVAWLNDTGATYFEEAFVRHLARRLLRDPAAAANLRSCVVDPATPDEDAALFAALLVSGVPLDPEVAAELQRRAEAQGSVSLAPIVRDPIISTSLSAKTLLCRVSDFNTASDA